MQALESNNIKLALMKIRDGLTNLACRLNIRQAGPMYFNGCTNNLFCYLIHFHIFSVPLRLCGKLPPERLRVVKFHREIIR
ncbi:MAG: hypothetical protein AB1422_10600 [bacterium]